MLRKEYRVSDRPQKHSEITSFLLLCLGWLAMSRDKENYKSRFVTETKGKEWSVRCIHTVSWHWQAIYYLHLNEFRRK